MEEADRICRELITENKIGEIVRMIPDEWLIWESRNETPDQLRAVYYNFLIQRLDYSKQFIKEAQDAAEALI
jgi:hypothetical protein